MNPSGGNGGATLESLRPVFALDAPVIENYAVYLHRILVGLAGNGFSAGIVAPPEADLSALSCPTAQVFVYPTLRLFFLGELNRQILLDQLGRYRPSLLHTFWPGPVGLTARLADELKIPMVITFHGAMRCSKSIVDRAAALIAPSDTIAAWLSCAYPNARGRQHLAPVGSYADDSCACFSRGSASASLIAVEPFDDARLFEPLLGAIRHLLLDGVDLMLALIGQGRAEPAIRQTIRQLGLSRAVTIVPPIKSLRGTLQGADIFLHLKDRGLLNIHLLEAFAVGLAVAGAPDPTTGLLADGQTAMLWKSGDEIGIYAALKQLIMQRDAARRLAQNAQQSFSQRCSVSCMTERVAAVYRQVCLPAGAAVSR